MAGFQDVELLSEPVAAAMAYGLFVAGSKDILVFDFGGGTLDVSALHIEDGGKFRVLSTSGDTNLGGTDVDRAIARYLCKRDHMQYEHSRDDFFELCEKIKIKLSSSDEAEISELNVKLTRKELEKCCDDIFRKCVSVVKACMKTAKLSRVDEIVRFVFSNRITHSHFRTNILPQVLVGGSTRIPKLRDEIRNALNLTKDLCHSCDETAVAEGAAIRACILSNADSDMVLKDVLMFDVLPISLGVKCAETGRMIVVIPSNSTLPCKKSRVFRTSEDNQKGVTVQVYEGDDLTCAENNLYVGEFEFFIPKSRRGPGGQVLVNVTFEINESGVVRVRSDDSEPEVDTYQIILLSMFIVLFLCLYLFFKIHFAGALPTESHSYHDTDL